MSHVPAAKSLRQQHLDGSADKFRAGESEQCFDLAVGKQDVARGVDDDHRIRQ